MNLGLYPCQSTLRKFCSRAQDPQGATAQTPLTDFLRITVIWSQVCKQTQEEKKYRFLRIVLQEAALLELLTTDHQENF